ncbi:Nat4 [Kluyveromyces lactis]|nr:Nat4 [Kluyveromyces lactis]
MSNYHSRHLRRVAGVLCQELNSTVDSDVVCEVFSNRVHSGDPDYLGSILPKCLAIIKQNLSAFYEMHGSSIYNYTDDDKGKGNEKWIRFKWDEMLDKDLVYIVLFKRGTAKIVGFASVALSDPLDPELDLSKLNRPCLFLYEIHLMGEYQSRGLGSLIFNRLLIPLARDLSCPSIELCVFTANDVACRWYKRLGFQLTIEFSENLIGMSRLIGTS